MEKIEKIAKKVLSLKDTLVKNAKEIEKKRKKKQNTKESKSTIHPSAFGKNTRATSTENARTSTNIESVRATGSRPNVRRNVRADIGTENTKNHDGKEIKNQKLLVKAQRDVEMQGHSSTTEQEIDFATIKKNLFWVTSTIGILACLGILCMFFLSLTQIAMEHEYFEIDTINIHGASHFNQEEIKQISGLAEGTNSFNVNINSVKARMFANPWIEDVEIIRKLPRTFEITVTERIPQFLLVHEKTLYYVDTKGNLISPISVNDFISLPHLDLGDSPNEALEVLPHFIEQMHEKKDDFPFSLNDMAWVRLSASNGIEMFWEDRSILLALDILNVEENISNISFVLRDLTRRNEINKVSEIHAGNGQVWFVYK